MLVRKMELTLYSRVSLAEKLQYPVGAVGLWLRFGSRQGCAGSLPWAGDVAAGPGSETHGWGSRNQPRSVSSKQLSCLLWGQLGSQISCVYTVLCLLNHLARPGLPLCLIHGPRASPENNWELLRANTNPDSSGDLGAASFVCCAHSQYWAFCCSPWCVGSLGLNYFWCCERHIKETVLRGTVW